MAAGALIDFPLAGLARRPGFSAADAPELAVCSEALERLGGADVDLRACLETMLRDADAEDRRLIDLGAALGLAPAELLATALAIGADRDLWIGRALARLQDPVGASRPTIGLLESALHFLEDPIALADRVLTGSALATGLLERVEVDLPVPECSLRVPLHLVLALRGLPAMRPGCALDPTARELPLPPSLRKPAAAHAESLARGQNRALLLRSGSRRESRAVATAIADGLGTTPLFLSESDTTAISPWLLTADLLPVFEIELGPSDRWKVPALPCYAGPILVTAGFEGGVECAGGGVLAWKIPVPLPAERESLWSAALGQNGAASEIARSHRHGAGRIAELSRLARQRADAEGRESADAKDIVEVAWASDVADLESLAVPVKARVTDSGLILPDHLRRDLDLALSRCRNRESLASDLGEATQNRYRPGLTMLLTGPSGTGKTLAAAWLASRLGLPLYRVDTASIVSKYIGETEKNLARLMAQAEHAEVLLLFDEADALFGKRTDVKQANDRFANAQTNYLLQRIESYEGIALLTSNSRGRFDEAFTRRLDFILEFPPPAPEERRALWTAHLGTAHRLAAQEINRLAALCDLAGGHIRNVVLSAAVLAGRRDGRIVWDDVVGGLALEYRKLGRQMPPELQARGGA